MERARQTCLGWRAQGNARHDPSREKSQATKSKEHRHDICFSTTARFVKHFATGLANARRTLRPLSRMDNSEAVPSAHVWSNQSTKKSSSFAQADPRRRRALVSKVFLACS
jgi:hypothetical protein